MIEPLLAREVVRDAMRDRIFVSVPVVFMLLALIVPLVRPLAMGGGTKAASDVGLGLVWIVGSLLAVVLGARALAPTEADVWILTRPVSRSVLAASRVVGLLATLGVLVAGLVLAWVAAGALHGIAPAAGLPWFALLLWLELGVVACWAGLLSLLVHPTVAALGAGGLWLAGHLSDEYLRLVEEGGVPGWAATALYAVVPDLDLLDVQLEVVHGLPLGLSQTAPAMGYALAWMIALTALSVLALERRDLP